MPDVKIPPDKAKALIQTLLKAQGGLAAMAAGNVPAIVDNWTSKGVSLYIESDSPLGRALIQQGVIKP